MDKKQEIKVVEPSEQEKRIEAKANELTRKFSVMLIEECSLKEIILESIKAGFDLLPAQKVIDICEAFRSGNVDGFMEVEPSNDKVGSNEWKAYSYAYSKTSESMKAMNECLKDFQEKH